MAHEQFLQRFFERVWHTDDLPSIDSAIDSLVSEDCVIHGLPHDRNIARAGFKQFRHAFHKAFDTARVELHDVIEDGERCAFRASATLMKGQRRFTMGGGGIAVIRDGRIVEAWNQWDFLGLVTQLGMIPEGTFERALSSL